MNKTTKFLLPALLAAVPITSWAQSEFTLSTATPANVEGEPAPGSPCPQKGS